MDAAAPTLVPFDTHVEGLSAATSALTNAAAMSWLGARVPTCPDWDLLDLLAHQGMVHRWATAAVRADADGMGNAVLAEAEGRTAPDPITWLATGAERLAAELRHAPADLDSLVFLAAAPPPKEFWARRQCHETTIHALDALAAERGRTPLASEVWFTPDLAADGIDELVCGFWPRSKGRIRADSPYRVHITPTDVGVSWIVEVSRGPVGATRVAAGSDLPETAGASRTLNVSGKAIDLYVALWNRGGDVQDDDDVLRAWRTEGAVTW